MTFNLFGLASKSQEEKASAALDISEALDIYKIKTAPPLYFTEWEIAKVELADAILKAIGMYKEPEFMGHWALSAHNPDGYTESKWIAIGKSKPLYGQVVLVCFRPTGDRQFVDTAHRAPNAFKGGVDLWVSNERKEVIEGVTHWAYLPEAPELKSEVECNHKWVTKISTGDPQEPNERVIYCDICGAEKQD